MCLLDIYFLSCYDGFVTDIKNETKEELFARLDKIHKTLAGTFGRTAGDHAAITEAIELASGETMEEFEIPSVLPTTSLVIKEMIMIEETLGEMKAEAFRLMEAAKTPNGKIGVSAHALTYANLSWNLHKWIKQIETGKGEEF
jgi:hypothetical protein